MFDPLFPHGRAGDVHSVVGCLPSMPQRMLEMSRGYTVKHLRGKGARLKIEAYPTIDGDRLDLGESIERRKGL